MSEEKLIQEIYDLTLQNNTARELDDAFKQGIEETIAYLRELNLLRLHDVVQRSEQLICTFELGIENCGFEKKDVDTCKNFRKCECCAN